MVGQILITFILSVIITPIVIHIYHKMRWLDDPQKNPHPKVIHTRPLPRGGGLAIGATLVLAILLFLPIDKKIIGVLGGMILLTIIGTLDDIYDLSPLPRLGLQILAAALPILSGIGIAYITNPLGGVIHLSLPQLQFTLFGATHTLWILSSLLGIIWVVWCMNLVNFSTGLDGQMPGYVSISAGVIALLSLRFHTDPQQFSVTSLALMTMAAYLGFLVFNVYPQRIMSGFGASTIAGYLLAILSMMSGAKLATALLVLALPTIDAAFVISSRIARGKSPFMGDRTHLHHRLMDIGWGKRRIAFFYWGMAAFLGFLALQLNSTQKAFTILTVSSLILGFLVWLRFFTIQFEKSDHGNGSKTSRSTQR